MSGGISITPMISIFSDLIYLIKKKLHKNKNNGLKHVKQIK